MSLEQKFNEAAGKIKALTKKPTDDELLELYAFFKQATVGDNNTAKPGILDLKAKYKWESWDKQKGTSKDAAMEAYIALANTVVSKYS